MTEALSRPLHEEHGSYLAEPSPRQYKQVARILKHLREEVASLRPELALPTGKMIQHLVTNCPHHCFEGRDWAAVVIAVLCYLHNQTDATLNDRVRFLDDLGNPLFPNGELFDEVDVHRFTGAVLDFLAEELHLGPP